MGKPKSRVSEVRVSGPLAPFAPGFKLWLKEAGYTPLSSVNQLRLLAHVSRWLEGAQLGVADLNGDRVQEYLQARRGAGRADSASLRGLAALLGFLAAAGALPPVPPPPQPSALDVLLASFQRYLLNERGLATSTAQAYAKRAHRFLSGCAPDGELGRLSAGDVTRAVLAESSALSVGSTQYFVAAVRSFLRFCLIDGRIDADLSAATLAVTGRRRSSLPKGMSRSDTEALLRSCDRRRVGGRRDHAVLLILLRLGLRASEVATLTLDDINWHAGELVVHGKGRRDEALPLPTDVGMAIALYLQNGRPTTSRREVFLSRTAPVVALQRESVSGIVRRACERACIAPVGPHCLRHTAACDMLRAGVPMREISQVLRHRSLVSTAIYAKVDLDSLRSLAQVWPGGDPR